MTALLLLLVLGLAALCVGLYRGKTCRLANEDSADKVRGDRFKRKLATAIGKPALAEASDDDVHDAADKHIADLQAAMANDDDGEAMPPGPASEVANAKLKEAQDALANEKQAAVTLANEKKTASEELVKANASLANARKAHADMLIGAALKEGRVLPVDKTKWEGDFVADFDKAAAALANAKPTIKVKPATGDLGARNNDLNDEQLANEKERTLKVRALVNEKRAELMVKNPSLTKTAAHEQAFAQVKKAHATLFNAMTTPEAKK